MISVFDLFSIGIGPSSSHTVGPMKAAREWLVNLPDDTFSSISEIRIHLFGSLALTGKGHGTDTAIVLGLMGHEPDTVDTDLVPEFISNVVLTESINILGRHEIPFRMDNGIAWHKMTCLEGHSNGMKFEAFNSLGTCLNSDTYFSIGGGFVLREGDDCEHSDTLLTTLPYPFSSGADVLEICRKHSISISELMSKNEHALNPHRQISQDLSTIWSVMDASITRGCQRDGILPGGLNVKRRAPELYRQLNTAKKSTVKNDAAEVLDWISVFALAVNEENAAGGRVVTAPTNGAAGIVPAVFKYFDRFHRSVSSSEIQTYFLTCGAIAILYKLNASISGAEMGCQGEVGVASSMAAAGLTALRGGSTSQIECAAEIAMEHHLGLTCDPVKGLVQIPCIERNTMGAIKAINAARLALAGDGSQKVSLDKVIKTMKQTGLDMRSRYKETSQGGLAINVIEC